MAASVRNRGILNRKVHHIEIAKFAKNKINWHWLKVPCWTNGAVRSTRLRRWCTCCCPSDSFITISSTRLFRKPTHRHPHRDLALNPALHSCRTWVVIFHDLDSCPKDSDLNRLDSDSPLYDFLKSLRRTDFCILTKRFVNVASTDIFCLISNILLRCCFSTHAQIVSTKFYTRCVSWSSLDSKSDLDSD